MTSANLPTAKSADKNGETETASEKELFRVYLDDQESLVVGLASVLQGHKKANPFIVRAAVDDAVRILREQNPSSLNNTRWAESA